MIRLLRIIQLLCYTSLIVVILTACGGPGPEDNVAVDLPTPSLSPTTPPLATTEPTTSPTSQETPTPQPTVVTPTSTFTPAPPDPTPTPADSAVTPNPDLNFAQVIFVRARQGSDGLWTFDTTVRHNDQGWDHYADAWQVVDAEGNLLAERVLTHPHDTEQPFTRSQSHIDISSELTQVIVRAKCNIHGFGGQEVVVDLTAAKGENFEVIRP